MFSVHLHLMLHCVLISGVNYNGFAVMMSVVASVDGFSVSSISFPVLVTFEVFTTLVWVTGLRRLNLSMMTLTRTIIRVSLMCLHLLVGTSWASRGATMSADRMGVVVESAHNTFRCSRIVSLLFFVVEGGAILLIVMDVYRILWVAGLFLELM